MFGEDGAAGIGAVGRQDSEVRCCPTGWDSARPRREGIVRFRSLCLYGDNGDFLSALRLLPLVKQALLLNLTLNVCLL